jgi:ornithine carbamoyltransferase
VRHFLGIDDLSSGELLAVLDRADELKGQRAAALF